MKIPKLAIIALITALLLLTGCDRFVLGDNFEGELVIDENTDPEEYTVHMFNRVLKFLNDKDSQSLYDLFSKYNRDVYDLMPEIENAVDFFDNEVIKAERVHTLDQVTVLDGYYASAYVTTKNKTEYWLKIRVITTGEKESKLGLEEIYIQNRTLIDEYTEEYDEWLDRWENGSDEEAPQKPDDTAASVNYCWNPKYKDTEKNRKQEIT